MNTQLDATSDEHKDEISRTVAGTSLIAGKDNVMGNKSRAKFYDV